MSGQMLQPETLREDAPANSESPAKPLEAEARALVPSDDEANGEPESKRYRTIFLSDIHLGTKGCQAEFLLDFMRYNESDTLYLVGDIVDCWSLTRSWYWHQTHNDVVQKFLRKARKGTRVIYVPGNHDEPLRDYNGLHAGGVEMANEVIHHGANGKKYLVIHGDEFDGVVRYAKWLAVLGDRSYQFLMMLNRWLNAVRKRMGKPYWSLSAHLKHRVKEAVQFMSNYEEAVAGEARKRGLDGVICGHIHHAEIKDFDGVVYMNDGDWVESCTALVEHYTGEFEIIQWVKIDHEPAREMARANQRQRAEIEAASAS